MTHNIRINPSTAKRAKTQTAAEYESFPPGRPSVVSEETWQLVQQGVALGAPCASKKQKVDCVYINLDSRADRRESIEAELSREGASATPPRLHAAVVHSQTAPVFSAHRHQGKAAVGADGRGRTRCRGVADVGYDP